MALKKDHAGGKFAREKLLLGRIVSPDAGAEAEDAVVRQLDRFLGVAHPEKQRDRAENLLAVGWRILWNFRQDRRRIIVPPPFGTSPPRRSLAPASTDSCTCRSTPSRIFAVANGPISVVSSSGSPTFRAAIFSTNLPTKSS